jgi:hypothetical protein
MALIAEGESVTKEQAVKPPTPAAPITEEAKPIQGTLF